MSFLKELQRRNVFRVALAYLVAAWLIIEVSSTLEEVLHLPEWADTLLAFFLILGFPLALFVSWVYEITPEGIRLESEIEHDRSNRPVTGRKLDRLIMGLMAMALAYFAADRFFVDEPATFDQPDPAVVDSATAPVDELPEPDAADAEPDLSIAVLPFVNMSSDPEQEFFSDGLTEELLNLLAGIDSLKVAARTSSFFYKNKTDTIPLNEIARQLGVAHILEGSVRRGGDMIRVTAQLIQADNGFHLWSGTFDRALDDVFAIQDEIAAAVTEELKLTLLGNAPRAEVVDTESWVLTQKGRFFYNRRMEGDIQRAREAFEAAVALDPDNAMAWLGLVPLYLWFQDPPDRLAGRMAADRALELDPENPEALMRRGTASSSSEEFFQYARKAIEVGPDDPLVLSMWAAIEFERGNVEAYLDLHGRALALDPLHLVNLGNHAYLLMTLGRLDEAERLVERVWDIAPENQRAFELRARLALYRGDFAQARGHAEQIPPSFERHFYLSAAAEGLGDRATADHHLGLMKTRLEDHQEFDTTPRVWIAQLHAIRGELDEAFFWLQQARDAGTLQAWVWRDYGMEAVAEDPRWETLVADPDGS